jgi:hypothetical protein
MSLRRSFQVIARANAERCVAQSMDRQFGEDPVRKQSARRRLTLFDELVSLNVRHCFVGVALDARNDMVSYLTLLADMLRSTPLGGLLINKPESK